MKLIRLAIIRKKMDLSQAELAQQAGIHQPYISQLENGVRPPGLKEDGLAKIAEILKFTEPPEKLLEEIPLPA